jgi:hypothetical protein
MAEKEQAQQNDIQHVEVAAVEVNAIEVMERATVDVQIATAHKYPRDIDKFIDKAKKMVAVDEETAASCIYRRPVGREDGGSGQKFVEGESVRLAEIVAATYGNLRVGTVISEMNPRFVKALGFAHDLESNLASKAECVESTVMKNGKPYSERMRIVMGKAAQAKARRDAIFQVVPKSLCKPIIQKARQIIAGNTRPIGERQEAVKIWMSKLSIEPERIFAALNVTCLNDVGEDELEELTGIRTALKDGDITLDEAFPPLNFQEKAADTQRKIESESGSEKIEPAQDEEKDPALQAKVDEQKVKMRAGDNGKKDKETEKAAKPAGNGFRYSCIKGHDFNEPKYSGKNKIPVCPTCLNSKIIDNAPPAEEEVADFLKD